MKKGLSGKLKDKIIATYPLKKAMYRLLTTPLFTHNPFYKYLYWKNIKHKIAAFKKPLSVQIENTNFCNLSCIFCPHKNMKRKKGYMSQKLFESIIKQCIKYGIANIEISGFGEALLDKNYLKKVKLAKEKGIKHIQTVSNGILLSKEISRNLIKAGLDYLSLSIDAATARTYGKIHRLPGKGLPANYFSTLEKNINNLIKLKKKLNVKKPILELRFKDFELNKKELARFIKKYSGRADKLKIYMNIFSWPGTSIKSNLPKKYILKFPCQNLWSTLFINWQGKVALCCQDYECRIKLGDINKADLMEIWRGKKLKKIQQEHLKAKFEKNPICRKCDINTHLVAPWW